MKTSARFIWIVIAALIGVGLFAGGYFLSRTGWGIFGYGPGMMGGSFGFGMMTGFGGIFMILFWIVEDFLWFVFNPAYGIRRFRREDIWWHAQSWWWFMPRDYWLTLPMGVLLYVLSWHVR